MKRYTPFFVCLIMLLLPSGFAGELKYQDLSGLRTHLRTEFLKSTKTKKLPDFQSVLPQMKRLVKGDASKEDIEKIRQHAEKLLKQEAESWKVSNIGAALYFFEGDLSVLRMYSKETEDVAPEILVCLLRTDGKIRESILKELDARELEQYIADALILEVVQQSRQFYETVYLGELDRDYRISSVKNVLSTQFVAKLPQSTKRDRLLLNFPFEPTGGVWMAYAHPDDVSQATDSWPEDTWRPPKNIFKWYYCNVIQEAGLEREFMKQLELRNMTDVIPDKLKPKDTREQN